MIRIAAGKFGENVVLFPKSVDYYRTQLAGLLESEQYGEAVGLLRDLLQWHAEDKTIYKEWKSLLEWIETSFPYSLADEEEEISESELYQRQVQEKAEQDPGYVKNLLGRLLDDSPIDRKMVALEQLAYVDHAQVSDILLRWLQQVELHPLIQFKVLQTLRRRGAEGTIELIKCGEQIRAAIGHTPLIFEDFPDPVKRVLQRLKEVCEVHHPSLQYFAEQTWTEFLQYTYGTTWYRQISEGTDSDQRIWAAALHHTVQESMLGGGADWEIRSYYDVQDESIRTRWLEACGRLRRYLDKVSGAAD